MKFSRKRSRRDRDRFERFNIVIAILLAGWVPSILMLVVSYTILTRTLESNILRDRQTFVQLIAHLVGDDLMRTAGVLQYYQHQPDIAKILVSPAPQAAAQQWLNERFFSHPRMDGMFITGRDGHLLASVPAVPEFMQEQFDSAPWRAGAGASPDAYISAVHPRLSDNRLTTDAVVAIREPDGAIVGFLGASVLVERIGRRLSAIEFADQAICQVLDQNGETLFSKNFAPKAQPIAPRVKEVMQDIRRLKSGHLEQHQTLYSFAPIESTSWMVIVEQPESAAYRPVHDLLGKIAVPAVWLIVLTSVGAWLAGRFTRKQTEAALRIEREVIFNEKILANMPSGIALIDPESHRFLQANEAFAQMAHGIGSFPAGKEMQEATFEEVKIAPDHAIEKVLAFGAPFQLIEQQFQDKNGVTRFLNINLLRLQSSEQTIQGVLYLVEDKTRDVKLRQELIGANAAKDQFLALLSHELRNPLSPVIAMVSELEVTAANTSEVRHALEVIRRNVELEARLIDDLLDVTRISRGKLQLSIETVSVHEVLRRACEICSEDLAAKKILLQLRFQASQDYVEGDPARLQQVFWNLLKNSVKFTPEKGRIVVETSNPKIDTLEIRTTDSGIGIDPEKIGKIFNAFEQGQNSITRRFGGLGLGLAISKAMVAAHGGEIRAESAGKDRGATFIVTLQLSKTPAKASRSIRPPKGHSAPSTPEKIPVRGAWLLVVDDHVDTCTGMKMILERRGYQVEVAHTAEQAVGKAKNGKFDLLISDLGLPDRSGFDLMKELAASQGLRGIALSGFGTEGDVKRAGEAGFAQHLTKPINFERLEEAIQELLETETPVVAG